MGTELKRIRESARLRVARMSDCLNVTAWIVTRALAAGFANTFVLAVLIHISGGLL